MADPKQVLSKLASKLKDDPEARSKFIAGLKNVLSEQGVDTSDKAVLDHFGITERGRPSESSVIITITA